MTRRDSVLAALRAAGEDGVTWDQLRDGGAGPVVGYHVESLRAEGHRIRQRPERTGREGASTTRFVLVGDAERSEAA